MYFFHCFSFFFHHFFPSFSLFLCKFFFVCLSVAANFFPFFLIVFISIFPCLSLNPVVVAQLVEDRAVMWEVASSTPGVPTFRVLK